jgi:Uma2 family endonuclease
MKTVHWTSKDLEILPEDDGTRYEIIDGELYVTKQPHKHHQLVCTRIWSILQTWSIQADNGEAVVTPGLIFTDDNDVAPDVTWMSNERLATTSQRDGKYHTAPDLAVEVLSPGTTNEQRDREFKLWLYSRRGVLEYWIFSWMERRVEIYRRDAAQLKLHSTLYQNDTIQSPHLSGFTCQVSDLFQDISRKLPGTAQS